MPHQCVKCSRMIAGGSKELLDGCKSCRGHFFFYIRDDQLEEIKKTPVKIPEEEKKQVEKDIREMAGITQEDTPVILDIESVRVTGDGKFEIDIVNLFKRDRPLIYKLEEGKYIIDLSSTIGKNIHEMKDASKVFDVKKEKRSK